MEVVGVKYEIQWSRLRRGVVFPEAADGRAMMLMSGKLGQAQGRQVNHCLQGRLDPPVKVCPLPLSCSDRKHPSSKITHTMSGAIAPLYQERGFSIKSKMKRQGLLNTTYLENTTFHFLSVGGKGSLLLPLLLWALS